MKWIFGGVSLLVFFVVGAQLGGDLSADTKFAYSEATREEQQAWLDTQKSRIERDFSRQYVSTGVSNPNLKLKDVAASAGRREIAIVLEIPNTAQTATPPNFRQQVIEQLCQPYRRSALMENDIRLTMRVVRRNGSPVTNQTVRAADCQAAV
ncbi:MAG: hypothetical protein AAFQ22_00385 [Pseudomonadota bacterium]